MAGVALPPFQVKTNCCKNDQWQPVITVKPDGTRLFVAWYDRRKDTNNNSLIEAYGCFANLPITGANNFATNFPISTVQFPPVFAGTNMVDGAYDPAYPPNFGQCDSRCCGSFEGRYRDHMGDYDMAVPDNDYVYYTWADNRTTSTNHGVNRNQADVRMVRVSWPK